MIADGITISRMLFSLLLLVCPPSSVGFGIGYLLCGVTDVLDGFAARRLHTVSEQGAALDSAADMVFAVVYAVRILPLLLPLPLWITIWTAVIAVCKITVITCQSIRVRRLSVRHSIANKLTGVLLFLLPLSVYPAGSAVYGAAVVCAAATVTVTAEIVSCLTQKR